MKILRLVNSIVSPAMTDVYRDSRSGRSHNNLNHGTSGKDTWRWYAGVVPSELSSDVENTLDKDSYVLTPVYRNNVLLKDSRDNICYNISTDSDTTHCGDILLLWSIPSRTYHDIKYAISGDVTLVGEGIHGKSRGKDSVTCPAPVLEIFGDCELTWTGLSRTKHPVSQMIKYRYSNSEWVISAVTDLEADNV